MRPALVCLGGFFYACLSACSSVPLQTDALLAAPPADLAPSVELVEVPFNSQADYQCGPAALATVLQWRGKSVQADDLAPQVFLPERQGSLQTELVATTRHYELLPYTIDKDMSALLKEVQAGNPVLVLQNLGLSWIPQWHYAVVIGYNLSEDQIVLRSGQFERHINSFALFERTWRRADYWGLVITAEDKLPVTALPMNYITAVSAFEQLGQWPVANRMYRVALERWPQDRNVLMALGNSDYAMQNWTAAERIYRRVLDELNDYAPALNNLANVLMEGGRYSEAEQFAKKAIEAAGPFLEEYKKTFLAIQARAADAR